MVKEGDLLWQPSETFKRDSNMAAFITWLKDRHGLEFADYDALWQWSVADIALFWECAWEYFAIESPTPYECVLRRRQMPGAQWFPGARVNFARHLLRQARPGAVAFHSLSEIRPLQQTTWEEVVEQTHKLATRMRALGVRPGERVVSFMPSIPETAIAFLAAASIGAVWSSCSPDFGINSVVERLAQVDPVLIFAADGYRYGARDFDRRPQARELIAALPTLRHVITVPYLFPGEPFEPTAGALDWHAIQAEEASVPAVEFRFEDVAFDHPLWVLYSSGTTGLPKAFVHGHGGVLIELLKFCTFHINLKPASVTFMFSTTGWLTWNVLVGCMLTGSAVVFYDGNPTHPDVDVLWRMSAQTGATFFGTSPAYVSLMTQNGVVPRERYDLSALEGIFCVGSPASPEHFAWFYENVKADLWLTSQSGGTDIASSFVGGCPLLPVYAGEIQTRFLGADVHAYDEHGNPVIDRLGELVVCQPLPSMPLYLWRDEGNKRYREAYFDMYPGVWRHGDYLLINARGGCYIRGRSDSTLNRDGVRIGTAEIYRTVEVIEGVADSLIVNLDLPGGRFFMPLFVLLEDGHGMTDALKDEIVQALRSYSPRHVPDQIYAVDAIPYTLTGKKMEIPVRKILMGMAPEQAASRDGMALPEALDYFVAFARERRDYELS